jgi:PDZ domain
MNRLSLALVLLLTAFPLPGRAQRQTTPPEEKGTYLGILFSPIPEALLDHLPQLPRDTGVLITHVLPESPAARAGLRRHDILLAYGVEKIRGGDHLARLIRMSKSGQEVILQIVRAGKEQKVTVRLGLGPVLQIAREERRVTPPGVAKPGAPAAVSVTAVPMDGNRLKVTFEYTEAGRIRSLTCTGNAEEIDTQLEKLPGKVQKLARVAVKRLRDLKLQEAPESPAPRNR